MARFKKITALFFLLLPFALLCFGIYFRVQATRETFDIGADGSLHIRWHLEKLNYAEYTLRKTPTDILLEQVTIKNALPLTSTLFFTSNFRFALAKKCPFFSKCGKPDEQEMEQLKQYLGVGRFIGKTVAGKLPNPAINSHRQRTPLSIFSMSVVDAEFD